MTIKCDELLSQIDNVLQKNIHVSRIRLTDSGDFLSLIVLTPKQHNNVTQ